MSRNSDHADERPATDVQVDNMMRKRCPYCESTIIQMVNGHEYCGNCGDRLYRYWIASVGAYGGAPGDPASVPDMAGECDRCGARVPRGARLCDACARLD